MLREGNSDDMRYHRSIDLRRCGALLAGLLLIGIICGPARLLAQEVEWREQRTTNFAILYPDGSEDQAQDYAQFVDGVYDELSAVFSHRPPTPVILRIYPTMELYTQVNPLAAQIPGVVAHAHTGRREISIALPQTEGQPPDQIVNNVRHELTHIIAADLSGDKLTTAFQEGIAQYIEHPSAELDAKMQLMQQVIDADRVLSWSELNRPGVAYQDPRISYPESYTIVAFLIERDGFATFRTFIERSTASSGYRGALEAAYGVSADQLEQEWRAQLESFVAGAYRNRAGGALDLSQAQALIDRGEYAQAVQELTARVETLRAEGPSPLLDQAETLLKQAETGQRAYDLAASARTALEQGDYPQAKQAASESRALLQQMDQDAQVAVVEQYAKLADQGLAAQKQLGVANGELQTLHIGAARSRLHSAYETFTRLGDEQGAALAQSSLLQIQRTQTLTAVGLVVLAALILGWNVHRRIGERDKTLPFG
jgi:hypothetical protein